MKIRTRQTPCLGVCSTTYGDLVCRGCKRFSHEIVSWNSFSEQQKSSIWQRLEMLRDQCVALRVRVKDVQLLRAVIDKSHIPVWDPSSDLTLAYQVLRFFARSNPQLLNGEYLLENKLEFLGLRLTAYGQVHADESFAELCRWVDDEFYTRSKAYYERNFKIPLFN